MSYKGPGFYNELGERVCSLHPESMQTFIDSQGFAHVQNSKEYEFLEDDVVEQARRDVKNELYGPRKSYHLDSADVLKEKLFGDNIKWGGTD
jgi:hypothetical protein